MLQKNLDAFFSRYPKVKTSWEKLLKTNYQKDFELRLQSSPREVYESGKLIDQESLKISLPSLEAGRAMRVLVLEGFGMGWAFQKLSKELSREVQLLFIVEPSVERFLLACAQNDLSELIGDNRFQWMIGLESDSCFLEFQSILTNRSARDIFQASRVIKHPLLSEIDRVYFERVEKLWRGSFESVKHAYGFRADSLHGLKNTLTNLPFIKNSPGVDLLKDAYKGLPAIVLSTGPSLQKSLDLIRELQKKAVLLAADASLKILLENGILPHFVLSIERTLGAERFFQGVKAELDGNQTQFLGYTVIPPEVFQTCSSPKWVAYRAYPYCDFLNEILPRGLLFSQTSVAHMCLRLAEHLGCTRVGLVGQDLAFDPKNFSSHSPGVAYSEWSEASSENQLRESLKKDGQELVWVPGNFVEKVPTTGVYVLFMQGFSSEARAMDLQIVNCTEGGAKIPGVEWRSLKDFSADWTSKEDLFSRLSEIRNRFKPTDNFNTKAIEAFLQRTIEDLKGSLSILDTLKGSAAQTAEAAQPILSILKSSQASLKEDKAFESFFVQFTGRKYIDLENAWNELDDNLNTSIPKRVELMRAWFEEMRSVGEDVLSLLQQG